MILNFQSRSKFVNVSSSDKWEASAVKHIISHTPSGGMLMVPYQ
jgi:hypothetical protein